MLVQRFLYISEFRIGPGSGPASLFYLQVPGAMSNGFSPPKDPVSLPTAFKMLINGTPSVRGTRPWVTQRSKTTLLIWTFNGNISGALWNNALLRAQLNHLCDGLHLWVALIVAKPL